MKIHWLTGVSGAIGALFVAGPLIQNRTLSNSYVVVGLVATGAVAGAVGGQLIGYLPSDNVWWTFKVFGVMITWQLSMAVALALATRSQRQEDSILPTDGETVI